MLIPGDNTTSILTDPNITMDHVRKVADKLEVPYNDKIGREKLVDRIIEIATAKVDE